MFWLTIGPPSTVEHGWLEKGQEGSETLSSETLSPQSLNRAVELAKRIATHNNVPDDGVSPWKSLHHSFLVSSFQYIAYRGRARNTRDHGNGWHFAAGVHPRVCHFLRCAFRCHLPTRRYGRTSIRVYSLPSFATRPSSLACMRGILRILAAPAAAAFKRANIV